MRTGIRLVSAGLALLVINSLPATMVKVANLQDLVEQSDRIFVARCIAREVDASTSVPFTRYTFEVVEWVKGDGAERVVVKQFGVNEPVTAGDGRQRFIRVPGMPDYQSGEEVLLFMIKESPIGLSAPAGLGQGVFRLTRYGEKRILTNEVENRNIGQGLPSSWLLSKGLSEERASQLTGWDTGPLDYDSFVAALKTITSTR